MYTRVHFFTVCCFPAAGVGPLAAARDPAVEKDRICLGHAVCPQLLLPTATMAPVQSPSLAHTASRSSSGPLSSLQGGDGAVAGTGVLLVHCDGAGEAAGPSSAISSTCHPTPLSRRTEKPSLSSGMCSCFPSGLQSCAQAPPALALPLAKCCAIAGLCPRRWGLTGYVFSHPPSGLCPPLPSPCSFPARMHARLRFSSCPTVNTGGARCPHPLPAPAGGAGSCHHV